LDSAVSLIQSSAKKPKGTIRVSAPMYFGRRYLTPIIMKFLQDFSDIKVDLVLSNQRLDPIKDQLDLMIRGAGYIDEATLEDSSMQMKLLLKEKIGLYASPAYLSNHGEPADVEDLLSHAIVHYADTKRLPEQDKWGYQYHHKKASITLTPKFNCNDIESSLIACVADYGIGRFTELNVASALQQRQLRQILLQYDWGHYHLYAIYPHQQSLPKRTRLLMEFVYAHTQHFVDKL
jgi:DNA-binding transcriptional LysR family regulator